MERSNLHRPLLSTSGATSTASSSSASLNAPSCIVQRLLFVIFIGVVSVWANYEAAKGFKIRVINEMKGTPVGDKFSLFYVYNDEATRLVQSATSSVAKILYSDADGMPGKVIDQVDVLFARGNLTRDYVVVTKCSEETNSYVLSVSPLIMDFEDFRSRFWEELRRSMAKVLLFDKQDGVPKTLINGLVEYTSNNQESHGDLTLVFRSRSSSGKCWDDEDPIVVARFLRFCEVRSEGFIRRLYQAMSRDDWNDHLMDKALGTTATPFCESLRNSTEDSIVTL